MIDFKHPMVLLQTDIGIERGNIRDARINLTNYEKRLKEMFEMTDLYKELKEKYATVTLEYIDEDETDVICTTSDLEVKTLVFDTQRIQGKLDVKHTVKS